MNFNLGDLFEQTFGYRSQAFDPQFKPVPSGKSIDPNVPLRKDQGAQGSPYYSQDIQGREYYMPVTLTYTDNAHGTLPDGSSLGIQTKWNLPYPVISVSSRKVIVETPLTERRGTVKELINIQDYEIVIKGFITGNTNEFPEADVTTLRTIYEQNSAISIQCPLTDIFLLRPDRTGSDQVVIKELSFPAVSGVKNVRPYEIRMVSDEPFNLAEIN